MGVLLHKIFDLVDRLGVASGRKNSKVGPLVVLDSVGDSDLVSSGIGEAKEQLPRSWLDLLNLRLPSIGIQDLLPVL